MSEHVEERTISPFPAIQDGMLERLAQEADERTLQPEAVDWKEIHRQAALARQKG